MPARGLLIFYLSILVSVLGFRVYFRYLRQFLPKHVRDYGPKTHLVKEGVPTMGGIVIVLSSLVATLVLSFNRTTIMLLILSVSFALIGGVDDYLGIKRRLAQPSKGRYKFSLECLIALGWLFLIKRYGDINLRPDFLIIHPLSPFWVYLLEVLFLVGMANGVNFTDGVDGLASSITGLVLLFLLFTVRGSNLVEMILAILGGVLVFLFYNAYPARVIMGDIGSLFLGASMGGIGVLSGKEWLIIAFGMVFVVETLSVMLQVSVFKLTGKRIIKMSPLHHHFELSGWSEPQVVTRFSIFSLIISLLGVFISGITR
ncbi:MAG: phospho-N-acetylmuramoyl-pentapeptide-transferase [bacterium]